MQPLASTGSLLIHRRDSGRADVGKKTGLELIASENYTSVAVMQAMGTVLTNKYAEGLPGRRYYGGCEHVDVVERIARRPREGSSLAAYGANVQPHSGASGEHAAA